MVHQWSAQTNATQYNIGIQLIFTIGWIYSIFNQFNSNKSRFALHILGVTKIKTADNSSVLSTCSNVWFLLLIYQSFYPLQFVASFKQVAWVWMLDPFSRTVGRAGLNHYKYNVIPTPVLSKRQYYGNSVNNKWFFRRKWLICH